MRLFVAVPVPPALGRETEAVQKDLETRGYFFRWVKAENFHVTLKFLGSVESGRVADIESRLGRALREAPAFWFGLKGLGAFPSAGNPASLWIGVAEGEAALSNLAERVETHLTGAGFIKENRPYRAHLTIGRLRKKGPRAAFSPADWASRPFGRFRADQVFLMESVAGRGGPAYRPLARFALAGAGA